MNLSSCRSSHFLRKTERKKHQMTFVEDPNPLFLEFVNRKYFASTMKRFIN